MSQQGSQGQGHGNDSGRGGEEQITWVGEQRLMHGYCGRAENAVQATTARVEPPATPAGCEASRIGLPVAVMRGTRRRRHAVVRVGPPAAAENADAAVVSPSEAA